MSQDAVEELLNELFASEPDSEEAQPVPEGQHGLPGLEHIKRWLSNQEQATILQAIEADGLLKGDSNQAMFFGQLPAWCSGVLANFPTHLLPTEIAGRQPLFNQAILNCYRPGEGICDHVDLMRFQDGIASISLGAPAIMQFTELRDSTGPKPTSYTSQRSVSIHNQDVPQSGHGPEGSQEVGDVSQLVGSATSSPSRVQVLLEPGDLLIMHGPARYGWMHGIRAVHQEVHEPSGQLIQRGTRVSITLRRLCDSIVLDEQA